MNETKPKKKLSGAAIVNIALALFIVLLFVNPSAKALMIRGLMKLGMFSPHIPAKGDVGVNGAAVSGTFSNKDGHITDLQALRGKVIFLNFWATWCPPCQAEIPSVNDLYNTFKADTNIIFLLVDADGDITKAAAFMTAKGYSLPTYVIAGPVSKALFEGSMPTSVVINKQGRAGSMKHTGMANYNTDDMNELMHNLARE